MAISVRLATKEVPFETEQLNKKIVQFFTTPLEGVKGLSIGQCKWGVYAFYDYDGEPIYVGQTNERLSGRVRRHLTNRRTDAVAMSVLDPFEVHTIEVWPLPAFQKVSKKHSSPKEFKDACAFLNDLEAAVYQQCVADSTFKAVLNEKLPIAKNLVERPKSYKGSIITDEVRKLRDHPDVRLARRASTIARLALIISERQVKPGLRRTLHVQARRLEWLAAQRVDAYAKAIAKEDKKKKATEE